MADASPKRSYPPIPPWRVHLTGAEQDLQYLATEHSSGRTRVIHLQSEYFLEADVLDELSDCDRVAEKARWILGIICGLAKVRRFSALPVAVASVVWTDDGGNWVGRMPLPSVRYRIVPGTRYLEGANISEQILALAETSEVVRTNLIDFVGEWDFSRLRRIVDSILIDLGGDKKKGAAEVLRRGWATQPECARFDDSVNFGNKYYLGAHSPLDLAPGQNQDPLSLVMASEFVRALLARWIASKIAITKVTSEGT
jgi:hypothetical protein